MRFLASLVVLLSFVSAPAAAATLHTDTFDPPVQVGSTLGWEGGLPTPVHIATGGPAGVGDGFLKIAMNESASHLASYNLGTSWTGDFTAIGATRVTADLMSPLNAAQLQVRLVLFTTSGGRWTSTVAQAVPSDSVWRNYAFSIAQANLTQAQGFETYAEMLTTIDRVMLRHQAGAPSAQGTLVFPYDFLQDSAINELDFNHPTSGFKARFGVNLNGTDFLGWQRSYGEAGGTLNADNIQLAAGGPAAPVPEPTAGALLAWLAATVALRRYQLSPRTASSAAA